MSIGSVTTRWWEGYLVRYFMPSIAGVAIVIWLTSVAGDDFRNLLLIPKKIADLDGPRLILLFLYGNLFCYIASYPILAFHVTRFLDFTKDHQWPNHWWADGYIWSLFLGIVVAFGTISMAVDSHTAFWLAYFLVIIFVVMQLLRILYALRQRIMFRGLEEKTSPIYGYAYSLARRRRSLVDEIEESIESTGSDTKEDIPETGSRLTSMWQTEFIDTYRHMREHGNSAFIFFLELLLAALVYAIVAVPGKTALYQLSAIGVLFALWAIPAFFVHMLGQHLERRFSQYDRSLTESDN